MGYLMPNTSPLDSSYNIETHCLEISSKVKEMALQDFGTCLLRACSPGVNGYLGRHTKEISHALTKTQLRRGNLKT